MVAQPPSGSAVLATYGCLLSVSLIMILARFYLRIRIHRAQRLLTSDILMGIAWCSALTTATFDLVLRNRGALRPDIDWTLSNFETSQENFEYVGKMLWASGIPFYATLYLCKLSLLAVYLQLFPVFMKELRIALWLTSSFVMLSYIVTMCLYLFLCFPLERNWRIPAPEPLCPPTVSAMVFQVGWALHFIGSLAIFVLPFFVLSKLQMRRTMLIGVYGALSLGAIDIAFSLTRFLSVQLSGGITDRPMTLIELWSALDMMVGLIVTCLPSLRPYLRRNFKASSADDSRGPNSRTPNQHGISVNRTVITTSKPARWKEHGHFEEIEEDHIGENKSRVVMMGNDVQINERDHQRRVSWQDDKCSNNSDVQLIEMKR